MTLEEMRTKKIYRESKTARAYVYIETNTAPEISKKGTKKYIIHFTGKNGNHNCSSRSTLDQIFFRKQLEKLNSEGTTLKERLPPGVKSEEGTIERDPYSLSFLSQTSACHKGNK